ncbi:MAG: hypothetical protein FRX49_07236 [Trebouxia sp. A1-2]|nr:MAG: hypothetical protein FRX49_07236 [Trebouxia sp. A1-2]
MTSVAAVQSAIQALYGTDEGQRQAANIWLTEFANSDQAWESLQLLHPNLAPEVQFFSVNLLLSKVKHAWRKLQPEAQRQIQIFAWSKLDEVVSSSSANKLIKQRLSLLLATMAAADGADAGAELIQHAMRFAQPLSDTGHANLEVMLDLLLSLAEEASALDSRRQASFVNKAMQPQAARVFDTLGKVLQGSSSASESEEGEVDEAADQKAMSAIIRALLGCKHSLQGTEAALARARLVAKVAAAMADRSPEAVAQDLPEAVQLAELLLTCLSLGERQVAEFAIDYLDSLSTVPLAERQPQLQQPLYSSLLHVLAPHIQYPQEFTDWDGEQSLQEVLEISFGVLKGNYLAYFGQQLQSAASWQATEAALFAIRCVSSSILEMASSDASPDQPQANAHQQTVRAFLSSLFGQLCAGQGSFSQKGLLQQPCVLASAARLIGDYAMWFSRLGGPEAPLEGALRLLLQAMVPPQARLAAAKAFRVLCVRCAARLSSPAVLSGLVGVAHTALNSQQVAAQGDAQGGLEDRQHVIEGLSRVAAQLPVEEAAQAGQHLIAPFLQQAQACLDCESGSSQQPASLAAQLRLIACAIKSMEFGSAGTSHAGGHPVLSVLEAAQPVLTRVAASPALQANATVVSALCEGNQLAANQDLVTALFHLADQCILIAPALALACGAMPSLFQWAVQGLQMREAEPLRKALKGSLHNCMTQQGQGLVQAFVLALVQSCPRHLLRPLANPLHSLIKDPALTDGVKGLMSQVLCSQQYADLSGGGLDTESCQLFCRLAMQTPPLSPNRFSALVQDFGILARGDETPDVLLAYEL